MNNQHQSVYKEEAYELLAELESSLLELEQTPDSAELVSQVFRSMHTIKGSGAMFGFDNIAAFTHEVETVYDVVRDGKLPVTKPLIDLTLAACDLIKVMVDNEPVDPEEERTLVQAFQQMLISAGLKSAGSGSPDAAGSGDPEENGETETSYRIRFHPDPELFMTGNNPLLLLKELHAMGDCEVAVRTGDLPVLREMSPETCYLRWDVFLSTDQGINAIRDVFIFVEDHCALDIQPIDSIEDRIGRPADRRLGQILMDRGEVTPEQLEQVLMGNGRIGEMLIQAKAVDQDTLDSALIEQQHLRETNRKRQQSVGYASSIRVAAEKLDAMVNMVGELVTVQARLTRKASIEDDPELTGIAEEVERLSAELRDTTMNIRMLPVGSTFKKFRRLVYDLASELGKEVNLVTEGEEVELDKTVLEQLNDPLVHIIRNAVDHGIEHPEVREARGKPRQGTIRLSAEHVGSEVMMRVSGDGAGIDTDAIRAKAVEKELIAPDAELTDKEIHNLMFAPGFSTAAEVSDVSGRGVGMDVVRQRVESLRGTVEIFSRRHVGTTITLKLPLTLAIEDGLLVTVGDENYIVPLLAVEECVELARREADRAAERSIMTYREEIISYVSLRNQFRVNGHPPEIEKVVVVQADGGRVGFGVDRVIGQHQTVIKNLGRFYRDIKSVSGATILGDGTVALILDMNQLVRIVQEQNQ